MDQMAKGEPVQWDYSRLTTRQNNHDYAASHYSWYWAIPGLGSVKRREENILINQRDPTADARGGDFIRVQPSLYSPKNPAEAEQTVLVTDHVWCRDTFWSRYLGVLWGIPLLAALGKLGFNMYQRDG